MSWEGITVGKSVFGALLSWFWCHFGCFLFFLVYMPTSERHVPAASSRLYIISTLKQQEERAYK